MHFSYDFADDAASVDLMAAAYSYLTPVGDGDGWGEPPDDMAMPDVELGYDYHEDLNVLSRIVRSSAPIAPTSSFCSNC